MKPKATTEKPNYESIEPKSSDSINSTSSLDSSGSFSLSCVTVRDLAKRNPPRSKSLCNMAPSYNPSELARISERILKTNPALPTSSIRSLSRSQILTLGILALVDFMAFCSMSVMAPFFPREASEKGLTDTQSGLVFSFYALVMFIFSPIFGKALPKLGAKFMFLSGIFLAGSCNILFGFLEYIYDYKLFTVYCFIIRGFEALGASAYSTASYVFVINTFPSNIGSVLGIVETFVGLGMSCGPAIGGFLYSLGGFEMPFFVMGGVMVSLIPFYIWALPVIEDDSTVSEKSSSMGALLKNPSVLIIGLVVMVTSSTWGFLDPTLEPHLRVYNLTAEQIGLIFLLFSGLYGISSPCWGWVSDKLKSHFLMMICGLCMTTIGLLILGPCPYIPYLKRSLWLNLVALSLLGCSVALALLPTFQCVLQSAIDGGFDDNLKTYGVVAGVWSCMYSLGEVIGPILGGFLLEIFGFPVTATIMAGMTLSVAIILIVVSLVKQMRNQTDTFSQRIDPLSSYTSSTSGISEMSEKTPLLFSGMSSSSTQSLFARQTPVLRPRAFNKNRYESASGEFDCARRSGFLGTVTFTHRGACEV